MEGQDSILDGRYHLRHDAIKKCYRAAKKRGFQLFAIQNGGWCASSTSAFKTFNKYGKSSACKSDGKGGPWANQVYYITGKKKKTIHRPLQLLKIKYFVIGTICRVPFMLSNIYHHIETWFSFNLLQDIDCHL